ncbi:MAG: hypothetical protein OXN94_03815 [Chloroflexota bacterium]|nr:hypothetical protein [Chloroflexota bacterium]
MTAIKLRIHSRHREHMGIITSLGDFEWSAGDTIDAASLLDDPKITLYCLDQARERAIFTALPADMDLSGAPFMYQAQFDMAEFLVALPYADFLELAGAIPFDDRALLCLHNIGRCGSTVLARALNEIDAVITLSEPDALTNFVKMRGLPPAERSGLLRACLRWLCRPAIVQDHQRIVIKFRNQATAVMRLYVEAAPGAAHLFMYRNVIDWLASFHRLRVKRAAEAARYPREQAIDQQASYYGCPRAEIERLAQPSIASYRGLEGRAIGWLFMLEQYLELVESGAALAALRYEDLQLDRDGLLLSVMKRMGLPDTGLKAAQRAFKSDAQAGTKLARDGGRGNTLPLPEDQQATVRQLLAKQPMLNSADLILPNTLRVQGSPR